MGVMGVMVQQDLLVLPVLPAQVGPLDLLARQARLALQDHKAPLAEPLSSMILAQLQLRLTQQQEN